MLTVWNHEGGGGGHWCSWWSVCLFDRYCKWLCVVRVESALTVRPEWVVVGEKQRSGRDGAEQTKGNETRPFRSWRPTVKSELTVTGVTVARPHIFISNHPNESWENWLFPATSKYFKYQVRGTCGSSRWYLEVVNDIDSRTDSDLEVLLKSSSYIDGGMLVITIIAHGKRIHHPLH